MKNWLETKQYNANFKLRRQKQLNFTCKSNSTASRNTICGVQSQIWHLNSLSNIFILANKCKKKRNKINWNSNREGLFVFSVEFSEAFWMTALILSARVQYRTRHWETVEFEPVTFNWSRCLYEAHLFHAEVEAKIEIHVQYSIPRGQSEEKQGIHFNFRESRS